MLAGTTRSTYKPRRATIDRWLIDAPDYVLDVFHDPKFHDCYTVFLCGETTYRENELQPHSPANTRVSYLACNTVGVCSGSDMKAWQAVDYRYHNARRHRVTWLSLPEALRKDIDAYMAED